MISTMLEKYLEINNKNSNMMRHVVPLPCVWREYYNLQ